jgi:hypothetical protein
MMMDYGTKKKKLDSSQKKEKLSMVGKVLNIQYITFINSLLSYNLRGGEDLRKKKITYE